ncbi:hypothetical protein C0J52_03084 [Blattella germanica]|nr:hypothetical protein C0J52_03084 [Blattella germanica]
MFIQCLTFGLDPDYQRKLPVAGSTGYQFKLQVFLSPIISHLLTRKKPKSMTDVGGTRTAFPTPSVTKVCGYCNYNFHDKTMRLNLKV